MDVCDAADGLGPRCVASVSACKVVGRAVNTNARWCAMTGMISLLCTCILYDDALSRNGVTHVLRAHLGVGNSNNGTS